MNTIIYRTSKGIVARNREQFSFLPESDWDALLIRENLQDYVEATTATASEDPAARDAVENHLLSPALSQELWACGVTYYRSRSARMEESKDAGGGSFYDRVYAADRPELFFKATPNRISHPGKNVRIRRDSTWDVPEPEFTLLLNSAEKIIGFTAGNDMSSRSIEGENPLYLPQAETLAGPCTPAPVRLKLSKVAIWMFGFCDCTA